MSITNNGAALNDRGWNLLGNPYACPVTVSNAMFTNIQGLTMYVYSSGSGTFQALTNGSVLPAWQSFFVKVSAGTGSVTFNESDKNPDHTVDIYKKKSGSSSLVLRLTADSINHFSEVLLEEEAAAETGFDVYDGFGLLNQGPSPSLFCLVQDSFEISVNRFPKYEGMRIPLRMHLAYSGEPTLKMQDFVSEDLCLSLLDLESSEVYDLNNEELSFYSSVAGTVDRFVLFIGESPVEAFSKLNTSCFNAQDGEIFLKLPTNRIFDLEILGKNGIGDVFLNGVSGEQRMNQFGAGLYELSLTENGATCVVKDEVELFHHEEIIPAYSHTDSLRVGAEIEFTNLTKGASEFIWNFGDGSPSSTLVHPKHIFTEAGIYSLGLTSSNGNPYCDVFESTDLNILIQEIESMEIEHRWFELSGSESIAFKSFKVPPKFESLQVYSLEGKLIHSESLKDNKTLQLDIEKAGMYLISIEGPKENFVIKHLITK